MRRVWLPVALLVIAALTIRARTSMSPGLDYDTDARAAIDALANGDWSGFVANQPLMGSFSVLLRAPFAALASDSTRDGGYWLGVLPCLAALAGVGVAIGRRLPARGAGTSAAWIAGGLVVLNPLMFRALNWGHPEELLAAALCVGAVLAVLGGRDVLGALLLGFAIATKQWAVLAIAPVLLAGPRRPLVVAGVAGGIAAALTLPLLLADAGGFGTVASNTAGQSANASSTTPWNIWWPLAHLGELEGSGERWFSPDWVATISHPLIVLIAVPLGLALWCRRDRRPDDALLLLTLLLLLRCVLDNWDNEYYHLPFLVSLIAWETRRRPGVPVLSVAVTLLLGLTFWTQFDAIYAGSAAHAPLYFALYVAWVLPLAGWLALRLLTPGRDLPWAARSPTLAACAPASPSLLSQQPSP
jgi:hypothetical protein